MFWRKFLVGRESFGDVLARHRGIGPGFDMLRIALAVLIFIGHAKWVGEGHRIALSVATAVPSAQMGAALADTAEHGTTMLTPIRMFMVPAFFALSGFLVTGSALRLRNTSTFLANRALRIFPALTVEVALSAFLIGALFTTLPLADYFVHPQFFRYFGNAIGEITMVLPGVFVENGATSAINVNLWTLPAEFWCYAITAALMISRLAYNRALLTAIVLAATVFIAAYELSTGPLTPVSTPHFEHVIVIYFMLGCLAYHWRDRLPVSWALFAVSAALSYFCLTDRHFTYLAMPFVTYVTVFIGMIRFPRINVLQSGDYSYGLYLFGFPITQAFAASFPWFEGHPVLFTLAAGVLSCVFAWCSWHLIEKRALQLRKKLPERWFPTTPRQREATS